jgi:predicted O-methyltransferase YrrM/SAM-dependent methyltransferase
MKPALRLNVLIGHFPYAGNGACSAESPSIREWETQTILKMNADPRVDNVWTKSISDTPITLSRNRMIRIAKEHGAHLLLMVDSDQAPNHHVGERWYRPFWDEAFNFIYDRYQKGPHVVFAPYCGPPNHTENVYVFKPESVGNRAQETGWKLEAYGRDEASKMTGIQEAGAGPTGMILIDLRACDLIEPVAMSKEAILESLVGGQMTKEEALYALRDGYFYYEFEDQRCDQKASTEDVVFTRDIALAGLAKLGYNPVYCAWDSWVGHHKPWTVGKPQRYTMQHVNASYRKAVLNDSRADERIIEASSLNTGFDPMSLEVRKFTKAVNAALGDEHKSNGHKSNGHKGNGHKEPEDDLGVLQPKQEKIKKHQWLAWKKAESLACDFALSTDAAPLIVDIGPGVYPFPVATEFVGRIDERADYEGKPFHVLDLNCDRLPYEDQSVDFVYCRHTLEDLDNPLHLLREIQRVAKAGWLETPSPICETTGGVDAPGSNYKGKGYGHHRYLLWSDGVQLHVAPKLPSLDALPIAERQDLLNEGAWFWNTYHVFRSPLKFKRYEHCVDFNINLDSRYEFLIREACKAGISVSQGMFEAATGNKAGAIERHPWYDTMETSKEHLAFLAEHAAGKRVLEVGSQSGNSAIAMADAGGVVHCIDHWQGSPSDFSHLTVKAAGGSDGIFEEFKKKVGDRLDKSIFPFRKSSLEAAAMYWEPFDLIFIDAEHTYEAAKADILAWWPHLKDDGEMAVHDYITQQFPGVTKAVRELFGNLEPSAECSYGGIALVRKADYPNLLEKHCEGATC